MTEWETQVQMGNPSVPVHVLPRRKSQPSYHCSDKGEAGEETGGGGENLQSEAVRLASMLPI